VVRSWGPTPIVDQQIAGGIMWAGGDAAFLIAMILAIWVWMRAEEVEGRRVDAQLDRAAATAARAGPAVAPALAPAPADAASPPPRPPAPADARPPVSGSTDR
jgi:putative membrane protein